MAGLVMAFGELLDVMTVAPQRPIPRRPLITWHSRTMQANPPGNHPKYEVVFGRPDRWGFRRLPKAIHRAGLSDCALLLLIRRQHADALVVNIDE
jgi:hypothetical protein